MSDDGDGPGRPERPKRRYAVGYGKPPKKHQFKPGESGNQAGRPQLPKPADLDAMDLYTTMSVALNKKVSVVEGGRRRRVSIREVMVSKLLQDALKGDRHARATCVKLAEKADLAQAAGRGPEPLKIIIEGGLPDDDYN
jgi:hypothetical protein